MSRLFFDLTRMTDSMEIALALLGDELVKVETQFSKDLNSDVALIRKVGEYVLASGGKRIRPMLLLLCARLAGYQGDAPYRFGERRRVHSYGNPASR